MSIRGPIRKAVNRIQTSIPAIRRARKVERAARVIQRRKRQNPHKEREALLQLFDPRGKELPRSSVREMEEARRLAQLILEGREQGKDTRAWVREFETALKYIPIPQLNPEAAFIMRRKKESRIEYADQMAKRIALSEIGLTLHGKKAQTNEWKERIAQIMKEPHILLQAKEAEVKRLLGRRGEKFMKIYREARDKLLVYT